MKITLLSLVLTALLLEGASVAAQEPAAPVSIKLPAQPLRDALNGLARQTGLQVIYTAEDVPGGFQAPKLDGRFTAQAALAVLLKNSGLEFEFLNPRTVAITTAEANKKAGLKAGGVAALAEQAKLSLSQAGAPTAQAADSEGENGRGAGQDKGILAEVIVTAQKREESLQDVPIPITVFSGESLTQNNLVRLEDYYSRIPGLSLSQGTGPFGTNHLTIRGIATGGAPSVGVVIDDVPFGSAVGLFNPGQPDIDPGDLSNLEVLRGPQGVLYGANSMGGLLKFVTIDPSTEALSGRIQAGTSTLFNGVSPGYNFRGSVNIPINDTMAVRASAFRQVDGGFIDNVQTGEHGVNRRTSDGGRLSTLWKPSDVLSLKLSAILQEVERDGTAAAHLDPVSGDLQIRALPNTYTMDNKSQAYSATLKAELGRAELVSLTGYNVANVSGVIDDTGTSGGFWDFESNKFFVSRTGGPLGSATFYQAKARKFNEELRLSMPITDRINGMIGLYYTDEKNKAVEADGGAELVSGRRTPPWVLFNERIQYQEWAAFSNVTLNFTDRFDVQVGGRTSKNRQTYDDITTGPGEIDYWGCASVDTCSNLAHRGKVAKDSSFTYLLTPRYKISSDLMIYARFASGYRPGGFNNSAGRGIPPSYDAEKTQNYDLGLKADFLEHRLSVDAALYYIHWDNIAVSVSDPTGFSSGFENAGKAKSQGLELSGEIRPIQGLSVSAWVDWDDAKFISGAGLTPGGRLPYAARFTGNLSVNEEFRLTPSLIAFVGGTMSYVGDRVQIGEQYPAYVRTDLNAGVKQDTWTVNAYLNNVANRRGILDGGSNLYQYFYLQKNVYNYIEPRTFGLNVIKKF